MGRCSIQLQSGIAVVENGKWSHPAPRMAAALQKLFDPSKVPGSAPDRDLWVARDCAKALNGIVLSITPIRPGPPNTVY